MQLDPFAIRKQVDVRRLKHQLWDHLEPKLTHPHDLSEVMADAYYQSEVIDPHQVSIHSAFICLLHLANEKSLALEGTDEYDFKISKVE